MGYRGCVEYSRMFARNEIASFSDAQENMWQLETICVCLHVRALMLDDISLWTTITASSCFVQLRLVFYHRVHSHTPEQRVSLVWWSLRGAFKSLFTHMILSRIRKCVLARIVLQVHHVMDKMYEVYIEMQAVVNHITPGCTFCFRVILHFLLNLNEMNLCTWYCQPPLSQTFDSAGHNSISHWRWLSCSEAGAFQEHTNKIAESAFQGTIRVQITSVISANVFRRVNPREHLDKLLCITVVCITSRKWVVVYSRCGFGPQADMDILRWWPVEFGTNSACCGSSRLWQTDAFNR